VQSPRQLPVVLEHLGHLVDLEHLLVV
jgi:hypothetical protein